jgi:hypothetical protein
MTARATSVSLLLVGLLGALSIIGCAGKSTPPGPSITSSVVEDLGFSFLKWKEGRAIMFVDNVGGGQTARGSGSTEDLVYRGSGSSTSKDGHGYEWTYKTTDGKRVDLKIDGVEYDLDKGGMFVIHLAGDQVTVHQKNIDLSQLTHDHEECRAFLKGKPDLLKLAKGE